MSSWMSIGFDPDQMDPIAEPGSLSQATSAASGAAGGLNGSKKHGIAVALKRLVTRQRTFDVPELTL